MKKIPIIILFILALSVLAVSCDLNNEDDYNITGNFWAIDMSTDRFYRVDAELLASNERCEVWVEKGKGVTAAMALEVANEYKNGIVDKMVDAFGISIDNNGAPITIMDQADIFGDGNGKLCILLLDIKDNYKGVNDSYVAGYFYSGDFYSKSTAEFYGFRSNERDMIYIDIYPGLNSKNIKSTYMTLAHELQHLINFTTSQVVRRKTENGITSVTAMDTWIDEGLSSAAEVIYLGKQNIERLAWYCLNGTNNITSSIHFGNNFFSWGNDMCTTHGNGKTNCNYNCKKNIYAILDEYATVYLFFQWLKIHYGDDIYRSIISSKDHDYRAVTSKIGGDLKNNWSELIKTWHAANFIYGSNQYGYNNVFSPLLGDYGITFKTHYAPTNLPNITLLPGEGVYSLANTNPNVSSAGNISYSFLSKNPGAVNTSFQSGATLLTFNSSSNNKGNGEQGKVTGAAPPSIIISPNDNVQGSRSAVSAPSMFKGPFPIGAHDVLRSKGSSLKVPGTPLLLKGLDDDKD